MPAEFQHTPQRGQIFFWKYLNDVAGRRAHREWNLTADAEGCQSAIEICDELKSGRTPYRTLQLAAPTAAVLGVLIHPEKPRWSAPRKLRIESAAGGDGRPTFEVDESAATATLRLDVPALEALQSAFREIREDRGDYWVEIGGRKIWLWWYLSE